MAGTARNVVQADYSNGSWPMFQVPTGSKTPMGQGNSHTVSMWLKTTFTARNQEIWYSEASDTSDRDIIRILTDGRVSYETVIGFTGNAAAGGTVNDGEWHHVAWRKVSDTLTEVLIDGVVEGTNTSDNSGQDNINTGQQNIMNRGLFNDNGFTGDIANITVWSRALSTPEIVLQSKYATPVTHGCIGCWPLYDNLRLDSDAQPSELMAVVGGDLYGNGAENTTTTDGPGIAWNKPQPLYFDNFVPTVIENISIHFDMPRIKLY